MIPRFGDSIRPNQRYQRRPGAYAIIQRGNLVLLTFQAAPVPELQLPGGGIDPGENPLPALHREVLEETGYRIRVTARIGAFRQYNYMPEYSIWAEKICHVYLATPGPRVGPPTEDGHIALWMPLEEALEHVPNEGGTQFLRSRRARQLL